MALKTRKAQANGIERLTPLAVALIAVAIVVAIGAVTLGEMDDATLDEVLVEDESSSPSTPLPTNVTVDRQSEAGFVRIQAGSVSVVLEDTDPEAGTSENKTVPSGNFTVFSDGAGNIQYDNLGGNYSASEDTVFTDYTSEEEGDAHNVFDAAQTALQTFGDFFSVIIIVGIAAVLFLLLRVVRRAGRATA